MKPPLQALKRWKMKAPDLFVKNARNHPGPETYAMQCVELMQGRQ